MCCEDGITRLQQAALRENVSAAVGALAVGLTENADPKPMLKTKSVWSPINQKTDGLRILATRFRGRRVPTSRYDVWMPSLGPSERLLKAAQAGRISWARFAAGYRAELFMDGPIDARSRSIKNHGQKFTLRLIKRLAHSGQVTLMCHCAEDQVRCHRHVLRKLILSQRV